MRHAIDPKIDCVFKAIAGKERTEWRRIFVRLQGAAAGA
jgi:hypothetical protein